MDLLYIIGGLFLLSFIYSLALYFNQKIPCPQGLEKIGEDCKKCHLTMCKNSNELVIKIKEEIHKK